MKWLPTPEAIALLHEGQMALADMESHGIRIAKDYLEQTMQECTNRIKEVESEMMRDSVYRLWLRRFGDKTKLSSPDQLADVVYGDLGFKPKYNTKEEEWTDDSDDRGSATEEALQSVASEVPFVKKYFYAQKYRKAKGTYLEGIWREMVKHKDGNWYVHPSFNLNTVETFRSSCNSPNFMNVPVRYPEIGEMIRRAYIPRPGHQLVEVDLGQIEVRVPCFYNKDPNLLSYCWDSTKDMHRDTAAKLFFLDLKQAKNKGVRHTAKNKTVFPFIYGSCAANIAPAVWETIDRENLIVEGEFVEESGKKRPLTVREHLTKKGITELGECDMEKSPIPGTFEAHVKSLENDFWHKQFPVFTRWKREWIEAYHREGGCRFLTGFVMKGPHIRNQITNYPIQSVAFHIPLWAMIRINKVLKKYKFRSRLIGEVHDCLNFDVWPPERDDVIDIAVDYMSNRVKKHWEWINTPLPCEPEVCPIDGSWFEKQSMIEEGGRWVPASMEKWQKAHGPWQNQIICN